MLYTSLLIIITLRFTCGERKIYSTIKSFQNIMSMVVNILFTVLELTISKGWEVCFIDLVEVEALVDKFLALSLWAFFSSYLCKCFFLNKFLLLFFANLQTQLLISKKNRNFLQETNKKQTNKQTNKKVSTKITCI